MISVYGGPGDRRGQGTVGPGNRMFRIIRISRCIRSFRDIRGFLGFRIIQSIRSLRATPTGIGWLAQRDWMMGSKILHGRPTDSQ